MPAVSTDAVVCDCARCIHLPYPLNLVSTRNRTVHKKSGPVPQRDLLPPQTQSTSQTRAQEEQPSACDRHRSESVPDFFQHDDDFPGEAQTHPGSSRPLSPLSRERPPSPLDAGEEHMAQSARGAQPSSDTRWQSVGGPMVDEAANADPAASIAPVYSLGEPSCVRIAYLQAVYNNVFNKMPVRATNENLVATLQSLDAAGVLPKFPIPARTLTAARRRLGIDPDQSIIQYAICPRCWKHKSPRELAALASPNCAERGCVGIIYKEIADAKGTIKRTPFAIDPQVSLLQRIRCIVRRKGFRKLIRDSRSSPLSQNNDDTFVMTDMHDGEIWHEMRVGMERQRGEFGTIRDVAANIDGGDSRLSAKRFGLHLVINLDWFGALSNRPHSTGPIYITIADLPREQRFLQQNVICLAVTPGPAEPTTPQLNHVLEPAIHDVALLQQGVKMSMYNDNDENLVEDDVFADFVCTNCDTPAGRKIGGVAAHNADIHPCPWCHSLLSDLNKPEMYREEQFVYRDDYDMLKQKFYSKGAPIPRQSSILTAHGVRFAALDWLPGWLPSKGTALDWMHCIYLGVVAFLFTKVLFAAHMFPGAGGEASAKQRFENIINVIRWPSHITRLPKNLGENQSLKKADEWRRLLTVAPVVLWWAWKGEDDTIPDTEPRIAVNEVVSTTHSRKRKSLYDCILLLCAGVRLLSTKAITMQQAKDGQTYLSLYCQRLLFLGVALTINHHLAMHFARMVKLFGPVYAWWLFGFERFNGMLEKVKLDGHDSGRIELTMLRYWVQTHLIYELLVDLPHNASPHEHMLLNRIVQADAAMARGSMMTDLAMMQAEISPDRVSFPKQVGKPVSLLGLNLAEPQAHDTDIYTMLLEHCRSVWSEVSLRRELSLENGLPFIQNQVASRLPYIRKDGLRYGCTSNARTDADAFAFIIRDGVRVPVEIEYIFRVEVPGLGRSAHACAIVRQLYSDTTLPSMPWDLHKDVLGIHVTYAKRYYRYEVIPATALDCPLALIPVHSQRARSDLWISVSFDHTTAEPKEDMDLEG